MDGIETCKLPSQAKLARSRGPDSILASDARMREVRISSFDEASAALRNACLAQSMYDAGAVIMDRVLLTLHWEEHRARRLLEFRVFRKNFLAYYEHQVFPATLRVTLAPYLAHGRVDLIEFSHRVTTNLAADFAGIDRPAATVEETECLDRFIKTFSEGATLVHSRRKRDEVEAEVREALDDLRRHFLNPSMARRQTLLEQFARREITQENLPRNVPTVLFERRSRGATARRAGARNSVLSTGGLAQHRDCYNARNA